MVDSSVGGKTGCNLNAGKNLAGAFYQPELVICDTNCLETLSDENFSCGIAEAIKTAVIQDAELFEFFKNKIQKNDATTLKEIISRCVKIKASIVEKDEKESGLRQILNFGHTLGHAIEHLSNYKIPHGEAVSIGMSLITKSCVKMNKCSSLLYEELIAALKTNNLPVSHSYNKSELFKAALSDKKRNTNSITVVFSKQIGSSELLSLKLDEFEAIVSASFD
jgi:3-dehydroquinate synthase